MRRQYAHRIRISTNLEMAYGLWTTSGRAVEFACQMCTSFAFSCNLMQQGIAQAQNMFTLQHALK